MRRNGKSLGQMAREEIGVIGGTASLIGTFLIMVILIAVLGLVVVNAMKHSPWATSTVAATIPIAIFIGIYLRSIRSGRVLEASLIGFGLLLLAVFAGGLIDHSQTLRAYFDHDSLTLAWAIIFLWLCSSSSSGLAFVSTERLSIDFCKAGHSDCFSCCNHDIATGN
jgi:carbon starvation protein